MNMYSVKKIMVGMATTISAQIEGFVSPWERGAGIFNLQFATVADRRSISFEPARILRLVRKACVTQAGLVSGGNDTLGGEESGNPS